MSKEEVKEEFSNQVTESITKAILENSPIEIVVVHREDDPKIIHEEVPVKYSGTIKAPSEFWNKRKADYQANECSVVYKKGETNTYIKLYVNEKQWNKGVVEGKLELNPDVIKIGINQKSVVYNVDTFKKFLKFNVAFFTDRAENLKIQGAFEKFKAKVNSVIEKQNDQRGNIVNSLVQTVDTEAPMNFTLTLPVFKGFEAERITCDILFNVVNNGSIEIFIESAQLQEKVQTSIDKIIEDELKNFEDIICIEE